MPVECATSSSLPSRQTAAPPALFPVSLVRCSSLGLAGNSGNQLSLIGLAANSSGAAGTGNGRATARHEGGSNYFPDVHHLPLQTSLDDNGILNGLETPGHGADGECHTPPIHRAWPGCWFARDSFFSHHIWLTRGPFDSSRVPPEPRPALFLQHDRLVC